MVKEEKFVSYLDDDGKKVDGYFVVLKITDAYIKIKGKSNILILPMHRVLKIKELNDKDIYNKINKEEDEYIEKQMQEDAKKRTK